ncbi:MAG: hypothetical protein J6B27_03545 [Alistipes sp.]|nr:hypothetical protein [Alistipes sp.]MBQ3246504.1 hypothetical protein [Alistipes sp.]
MKGIRKRVTIGFMSIVTLLFFSGMVSLFELGHLSTDAEAILDNSHRNMELAKGMFSSLHKQNYAVAEVAVLGSASSDSLSREGLIYLENSLAAAYDLSKGGAHLDSLTVTVAELRRLTNEMLAALNDTLPSSFDRVWYNDVYMPVSSKVSEQINDYMSATHEGLTTRAEQLDHNAYRAVMPVLISLLVMIAIVLMLYYFITIYCVNPVLSLRKSLADWLAFRLPFAPKSECRDELLELKEDIETLINQSKQTKA